MQLDRALLDDGVLAVPESVNGRGPFLFLFDSGGGNLVDTALAEELGVERRPGASVGGPSGGVADAEIIAVASLTLGTVELRDQTALVVSNNNPLFAAIGGPIRGSVGGELLQRFVATIDYQAGAVTLTPPALFEVPPDAIAFPAAFPKYPGYSELTPMIPARIDGIEGGFLVDTGDNGGIALFERFVAAYGLSRIYEKQVLTRAVDLAGSSGVAISRARSFRVGSTTMLGPIIEMRQGSRLASHLPRGDVVGSLGNDVLRHFTVIFDYPHERILLESRSSALLPPEPWNRAGFASACRAGRCEVVRVIPASPAAEAGIREGDIILSLDGVEAAELSGSSIRRVLARPVGTMLKISVMRAVGVRDIPVVLRDLL